MFVEAANDDWEDHRICNMTAEMKKALVEVYEGAASPVLDSHVLHLQKQWAKGRTAP